MQIKTEDLINIATTAGGLSTKEALLVKFLAPPLLKIVGRILGKLFPKTLKKLEGLELGTALELAKEYENSIDVKEAPQTSADVKVETKPESKTLINIHEYDFSKMNMKYFSKADIL